MLQLLCIMLDGVSITVNSGGRLWVASKKVDVMV